MGSLRVVPIETVIQSKSQLREVDRASQKFKDMVSTMKLPTGLINPISVRVAHNKDLNEDQLMLCDGAHRLAACKEAGMSEIGVNVLDTDEEGAMFAQMIANAQRIETKHYEFAKQLRRILSINPELTIGDLAARTGLSEGWIRKLLKLDKLKKEIGASVDKNSIGVMSAIAIAQLPEEQQAEWAEKAIKSDNEAEFCEAAATFLRERKKAEKDGRDPSTIGFVAHPKLRKYTEIKALYEDESGATVATIVEGAKSAKEAGQRVVSYLLQVDAKSLEVRKANYDATASRNKDTSEKKKLDAKKKLADKRAKEAADLQAEIAKAETGVAAE